MVDVGSCTPSGKLNAEAQTSGCLPAPRSELRGSDPFEPAEVAVLPQRELGTPSRPLVEEPLGILGTVV
jgi:hypothetical protein